jgi:uncharacterized protein YjbJ (UPF0337 family)
MGKARAELEAAILTDDDLDYAEGTEEELLGRIRKRTGKTREEVEKAVKDSGGCGC